MKILVLNGPNLNFLGIREPEVYCKETYNDLCSLINEKGKNDHIDIEIYQSNHEGALIDKIQQAYFDKVEGIVINPGGYTHTSIAIMDALKAVNIPTVEVHISNVDGREDFRKQSYISYVAKHSIKGHGFKGYLEAIDYLLNNK